MVPKAADEDFVPWPPSEVQSLTQDRVGNNNTNNIFIQGFV